MARFGLDKAENYGGQGGAGFFSLKGRNMAHVRFLYNNIKDVEGYDLTHYVDDYDKVTAQGINASWYALMASKMGGFDLENEERYLENIKRSIREKEYPGAGLSDYLSIENLTSDVPR